MTTLIVSGDVESKLQSPQSPWRPVCVCDHNASIFAEMDGNTDYIVLSMSKPPC